MKFSMSALAPLDQTALPAGIRSRFVENINGLRMHALEAGFHSHSPADRRPCVLLLHGFPELAYSWRKVMLPLAQAGFHVVAPDQRGYGRTTGWDADYDGELASFRMLGCHLVDGAGHWVQQEQPQEVSRRLLEFLAAAAEVSA